MVRPNLSNSLIHLTRERNGLTAEEVFDKIVNEKKLIGSTENIKGRSNCLCFSETPISAIGQVVKQGLAKFRYKGFGFLFSKKYLYDREARPAIYQPDSDFSLLPEDLQYRHVRFELDKLDWTWEREWRMKTDYLDLEPDKVTLIVPERKTVERYKQINSGQNIGLHMALGDIPYHKKLEWHFISLEDLGY